MCVGEMGPHTGGGKSMGEGKQDFYCLFGHGFSRPCVGTVVKVSTDVIVVILFERFCFVLFMMTLIIVIKVFVKIESEFSM